MRLPGYRLFANVEIGRDIPLERLRAAYESVLLAYGAADGVPLGVRGEHLQGSLSASEFVGWYNGHPDHSGISVDLSHTAVAVIGNGNVALDVCRILASPPERLAATDIADTALHELRRSRVQSIYVIGRRGPEEASFATAELRELATEIEGCSVLVAPTMLAAADSVARCRTQASAIYGYYGPPRLAARMTITDASCFSLLGPCMISLATGQSTASNWW